MFAIIELLFVAGTIALYIKWILIGVAIFVAVRVLRRGLNALAAAEQRRRRELDAVRARADQQHQWVWVGDPRGWYGEYPPAV